MSPAARSGLAAAIALVACKGEGVTHERLGRTNAGSAAVVVVDRPTSGRSVAASDLPPEREPNATAANAGPIGAGVQGALDGEIDVDAFVVTSPGPRMLTASLAAIDGVDAVLELRDREFAVIVASDRGGAGVGEGLAGAPLDKGTYYLVVRERPAAKAKAKPTPAAKGKARDAPPVAAPAPTGRVGKAPYTLTARLVEDPVAGAEREPDDDPGSANDLSLIEPATGHVGWTGDVDVWKLSLEGLAVGNGLDLQVTGVPGVTLSLTITDAANRPRVTATGLPGQPLALRSVAPRLDPGEPAFHHVVVRGKPSNPDSGYTLTVAARLLDLDEEAEPNDRPEHATKLRYGAEDDGTMRGAIGPGEVDVFALSPSAGPRHLDAAVDGADGLDLVCEVLSANGKPLTKGDHGGAGAGEEASAAIAAGVDAFVRVTAKPSKKPVAPVAYTLRWSSAVAAAASSDDPLPPEE